MPLYPDNQIRLARLLLERNYDTPVTIEELSQQVALSPYHLIRTFKRAYKKTPHQYLVEQRITHAKELLRNTDLSVTEICLAVGYESLGSFSILFRKIAGLSPSAYRINSNISPKRHYIPFYICLLYGLKDQPDF